MRAIAGLNLALLLAGCSGEAIGDEPQWTGSISFEHDKDGDGTAETYTADLDVARAFSFATGGKAMLYVTSSFEPECEDVVGFLDDDDKKKNSYDDFLPGGKCNLFLKFEYDELDGYAIDQSDPSFTASLDCAAGEGEWEWTSENNYDFWDYTGVRYRNGGVSNKTLDASLASADDEQTFNADIDFSGFTGQAAGDQTFTDAAGTLSGYIEAERCSGFAQMALW